MATKKHNIVVLAVSAVLAIAISLIQWKNRNPVRFESRVYESATGWGYDILADDKLLIRQESIPGNAGSTGFSQKKQAEQTARLIINKMERGQSPTVTTFEINQICTTAGNGEQGKH